MSNSHTSGAGDSADTDDTTEQDSSVIRVNPQHYKQGLLVVTLHILQTHLQQRLILQRFTSQQHHETEAVTWNKPRVIQMLQWKNCQTGGNQ